MNDEFYKTIVCTVADAQITGVFDTGFFALSELTDIPHRHKGVELHISAVRYLIEDVAGKSLEVYGDNIVLVPENIYHNCITPISTRDRFIFRLVVSRAEESGSPSVYEMLSNELSKENLFSLCVKDACVLLANIKNELLSDQIGSMEVATAYFSQFAVLLSRAFEGKCAKNAKGAFVSESPSDDMMSRNEKIEAFFNNVSTREPKAEELANELGLSTRQLNRIFKSYYNSSFGQMLTETRLVRASKLLLSTEKPIEAIAYDVGYRSFSAFLAAFKKRYGTTPAKYRRGAYMS